MMKRRCFCFPYQGELVSIKKEKVSTPCLDSLLKLRARRLKLSERDKVSLNEAKQIIESYPSDQPLHLKQLCRKTGINEFKLKTGFRMLFSCTPYGYFLELKMLKAQKLLLEPDSTINGVAYTLGYQHASNFCIQFKRRFGVTPLQFKRTWFFRRQRG